MTLATRWGRAIKAQREVLQLTQAELAERLGVSVKSVGNWEQGVKCPTPRNQVAIGKALHVDPRLLFTYPREWAA